MPGFGELALVVLRTPVIIARGVSPWLPRPRTPLRTPPPAATTPS